MALDSLASLADLQARGVDVVTDEALVQACLDAASSAIRDAAGCSITLQTSTIEIEGVEGRRLALPGGPLRSVASVLVDDVAIEDYRILSGSLYRARGWSTGCVPSIITVTYDHGYDDCPDDIAWLVGDLAIAAMNHADADTSTANVASHTEKVDDWSETTQYADGYYGMSVVEVPAGTKNMLRARFGGGTYVVRTE